MGSDWRGKIEDRALINVLESIEDQNRTGYLEVGQGDDTVRIDFVDGSVLRAAPVAEIRADAIADCLLVGGWVEPETLETLRRESAEFSQSLQALLISHSILTPGELEEVESLLTREIIFKLLHRTRGPFEFREESAVRDADGGKSLVVEGIVEEGARMLAEWPRLMAEISSSDSVFEPVGEVGPYARRLMDRGRMGTDLIERVFGCVDGVRPVARVVELSRLGTYETTRILAELRRVGLIDLVYRNPSEPVVPRNRLREFPAFGNYLRAAAASLLCLLLLGAVLAIGLERRPLGEWPKGRTIANSPLEEARGQFERLRLRYE